MPKGLMSCLAFEWWLSRVWLVVRGPSHHTTHKSLRARPHRPTILNPNFNPTSHIHPHPQKYHSALSGFIIMDSKQGRQKSCNLEMFNLIDNVSIMVFLVIYYLVLLLVVWYFPNYLLTTMLCFHCSLYLTVYLAALSWLLPSLLYKCLPVYKFTFFNNVV